jgi:glycosyltransferase involved in cell wall biosynthesis
MVCKISIVMAVYNKAAYLPESIQSVLNQDMDDFELICTDAGSTDNSLNILKQYAAKDSRITVHTTPYTIIPAATKNYCIDQSTGEYVFNLDADDYLSDDALKKCINKQ